MKNTVCAIAVVLLTAFCGCDWKPEKAPDRRNDAAERAARKYTGKLISDEHHVVPGSPVQKNLENKINRSVEQHNRHAVPEKTGKKQQRPKSKRK